MMAYTLYYLFLGLFLAQGSLCQPTQDSPDENENKINESSSSENPDLATLQHLVTTLKQYAARAANASEHLLKDPSLTANHQPQVLDFEQKLNTFLRKHDPAVNDVKAIYLLLIADFAELTRQYMEITEQELRPEDKFISELLAKYHCQTIVKETNTYVEEFLNKITEMFEQQKNEYVSIEVLKWFQKFITLNDTKEKLYAFADISEEQNKSGK